MDKDVRKTFSRERYIVLLSKDSRIDSGRKRGLEAVQRTCSFICSLFMRTETTRHGLRWHESNPVLELRGESYYPTKESSVQGLVSGQCRNFFALAVR